MYNARSQLQLSDSDVMCQQCCHCRVPPEVLVCDAEHELLAIAKFLVFISHKHYKFQQNY